MAHSAEEQVARDFICFGDHDGVVVVCDATCLERNLNLVIQTIEITDQVIVCVNLMDEAQRKGIHVDFPAISQRLGVPVVPTMAAQNKNGLDGLMEAVCTLSETEHTPLQVWYGKVIEDAIALLEENLVHLPLKGLRPRWLALRLLDPDEILQHSLTEYLGYDLAQEPSVKKGLEKAKAVLKENHVDSQILRDRITGALVLTAEEICSGAIHYDQAAYDRRDRRIDRILTGKWTGFPVMLLLLAGVFWLTITGANGLSQILSQGLFQVQDWLTSLLTGIKAPDWINGVFVEGMYRTLAWVVSVMLPPMAIFFPLFTLLEDLGYLPRVAFNLDKYFKKCRACGKQALTMCMGFGCNAAGIVGCRIIDSPRERMIAMLTNNFVPCNGRFPTLIAILTMFFVGTGGGILRSLWSALLLTGLIVLGILTTFFVSAALSRTVLKGTPSSFTLELPPYRKPQIGKVIIRSIFDRTLFVLGRAAVVAAPAGMIIWLLANISIGDITLLSRCAEFLDPFAQLFGLDGVILLAFILGLPANEIVVPIMIMAYLSAGSLIEMNDLSALRTLLVDNGWTWITAVSVMLFSLMHWPCSTTCLTIRKETGSWKWTIAAFLIPTGFGLLACFLFTRIAQIFI